MSEYRVCLLILEVDLCSVDYQIDLPALVIDQFAVFILGFAEFVWQLEHLLNEFPDVLRSEIAILGAILDDAFLGGHDDNTYGITLICCPGVVAGCSSPLVVG